MQLTVDLSQMHPEVRGKIIRKLAHEDKARHDLGVIEQLKMKKLHDAAQIGHYKSELGPARMILSQDQWQRAMQKYGQYIFMDPEFSPWLVKKHPDMAVKDIGTKIQVGYRGN